MNSGKIYLHIIIVYLLISIYIVVFSPPYACWNNNNDSIGTMHNNEIADGYQKHKKYVE